MIERLLCQRHFEPVSQSVQGRKLDTARLGDGLRHHIPIGIHQQLHLLAVGIRHLRKEIRLHGTLVPAGRRTENFGLNIELVEKTLVKHQRRRNTCPLHPSVRLQVDLVGDRCQIVSPLTVGFVIGDDELATLPEILKRLAQLLQNGVSGDSASVRTQVNTLDAGIVLGRFDGPQRIVKSNLVSGRHRGEIDAGERIAARRLDQVFRKIQFQNRVLSDRHRFRRGHGTYDSEQNHHGKKEHHRTAHDKSEQTGEKHFQKFHTDLFNIHSLRNGA